MDKQAIYNYVYGVMSKDAYKEFITSDIRINISRINPSIYSHLQYLIDQGTFNASLAVMNYYKQPLHTVSYVGEIIDCMRASSNTFHYLSAFFGTKRAIKMLKLQPFIDEILEAIELTLEKQTQLFHFHVGSTERHSCRPEDLIEAISSKGILRCS